MNASAPRAVAWRTGAGGRSEGALAVVALVTLALIWGYAWVAMKVALDYSAPITFAALRTFVGAVVLLLLLAALRRPMRPPALPWTLAVGLLQTTAFLACSTLALRFGGAGRTAVLTYTMPFWLLLLAWVFLGERLRGVQWAAVALAFTGFVLMLAPWRLSGALSTTLAVAGGFCWAASAAVAKTMQRRREVDLLSFTAWQMLLGSLPLAVVAALVEADVPSWTVTFIWTLSFTAVLGNAVAWYLWLFALRAFRAGTAGIGTLAIPVIGMASAWIQLGERPNTLDALGMTSILIALGMVTVNELVRGRGKAGQLLPAE